MAGGRTEQKSMLSPAAAKQLQEMSISVASGAETNRIRLLTVYCPDKSVPTRTQKAQAESVPFFSTRVANVQVSVSRQQTMDREAACSTPAGGALPHACMGGKKSERLLRMTQRDPPKAHHSQKSRNVVRNFCLQGKDLRPERHNKLPPRRADALRLGEVQVQRIFAATQGVSNIIKESRDMFNVRRNAFPTLQV